MPAALAGLQLDVVYDGTDGNGGEREAVARLDVRFRAAHDRVSHVQTDGREDVPLFAVRILQERDVRAAVRVVLDARNFGGDAVLIAFEIDDAVFPAVAAADVANRDLALVVSAAALAHVLDETLFRLDFGDLLVGVHRHETARGRGGFISLDSHFTVFLRLD